MNTIENVAVIGLGYIGLPTAAILAANGITVTGVDVNEKTIEAVNRGEVPFVEPDLSSYVAGAVSQNKLSASKDTPNAQAYIVAVPTPFNPDYTVDVKYIKAAASNIAPQLVGGELVILESTSPPGTTQLMGDFLISLRPDLSLDGADGKPAIHVAHCPERVLPGRVMIELVTNDRIVGGLTEEAANRAKLLYAVFCQGEILITDAATAEMAKLVENSYRDVNIAFANELSVISDKLGINVWELIRLANHHPRVNILQPGPGVGGHCIAVDPWFIVAAAPEESQLIKQARMTNDQKPGWVVDRTVSAIEGVDNPVVAVLGLAFKANIDDLRESPAVSIVEKLSEKLGTADLRIVEPHVHELPKQLMNLRNVTLSDLESAIGASDAVLLLVDHDDFKELDRTLLEGKQIIDTRGIWQ